MSPVHNPELAVKNSSGQFAKVNPSDLHAYNKKQRERKTSSRTKRKAVRECTDQLNQPFSFRTSRSVEFLATEGMLLTALTDTFLCGSAFNWSRMSLPCSPNTHGMNTTFIFKPSHLILCHIHNVIPSY